MGSGDVVVNKDITTIKLQKSTRDKLAGIGKKSESYDDIILRLLGELPHAKAVGLLGS